MSPYLFFFIAALLVGFIFALPARIPAVCYYLSHQQSKRWVAIVSLSAISLCAFYISAIAFSASIILAFSCPPNGHASFCGADSTKDKTVLQQEFFWRGLFMGTTEFCFTGNQNVCNAIDEYKLSMAEQSSDSISSRIMELLLLFTVPVTCGINVWFITLDDGKRKRKEAL